MVGEWSNTPVLQIQVAGLNPARDYDMSAGWKRLQYQTKWRYISKNLTLKMCYFFLSKTSSQI